MSAAHHAFGDYVLLEANSPIKHEYLAGQIYAMAGGTPEHAALAMAVGAKLTIALEGGRCRVYSSDLRIRVPKTGLATYPDVSVVCGPREVDPEDKNSVTNPTLLVEVTSKSTEDYDRGEKFDHYKAIPSLREYVLVNGDVRELMHDGCPTAWVDDGAFGYVNAFRDHVNVGFFFGALQ